MVSDSVAQAVSASLVPCAFFAPPEAPLTFAFEPQVTWRWEILAGRLLDPALTREERTFAAWHVQQQVGGRLEPRVSILLDELQQTLYVVRHIEIRGFEAYESQPNVFESRPVHKWTRELIRSGSLAELATEPSSEHLTAWCAEGVYQALCGTSRLPIASHESQLPAFALGLIGYWPALAVQREQGRGAATDPAANVLTSAAADVPLASPRYLAALALQGQLPRSQRAKLLEMALRASTGQQWEEVLAYCARTVAAYEAAAQEFPRLLRVLFNGLGLTPYIPLEKRLIELLERVAQDSGHVTPLLDTAAWMLLQLARHLTAFDLRTFHNYGADYPDLLLLDALLGWLTSWLDRQPDCLMDAAASRRRTAWLLAALLRKEHEGLPITPIPTSPGENQRVLPQVPQAAAEPVDDAEIMDPRLRRNQLFAGSELEAAWSPAVRELLVAAATDLNDAAALRTFGEALFLDRPLGVDRPPEAVDDTPLVSYLAFSRNALTYRLRRLFQWGWIDDTVAEQLLHAARQLKVPGFPAAQLPGHPRPGVVSLEDAHLAGSDFVFVRTTRRSLSALLACGKLPLQTVPADVQEWLATGRDVLLIRTGQPNDPQWPFLTAFDAALQPRATFGFVGD